MRIILVVLALFCFEAGAAPARQKRPHRQPAKPSRLEEIQKALETPLPPFAVTDRERAAEEQMRSWSRQAIPKPPRNTAPVAVSTQSAPAVKSWDGLRLWTERSAAAFAVAFVLLVCGKSAKLLDKRQIAFQRPDFAALAKQPRRLSVFSLQALKRGYFSFFSPGRINSANLVVIVIVLVVCYFVVRVAQILKY